MAARRICAPAASTDVILEALINLKRQLEVGAIEKMRRLLAWRLSRHKAHFDTW